MPSTDNVAHSPSESLLRWPVGPNKTLVRFSTETPETRSVPSLPTPHKHLSPLMFTGGADGNGHLPRPRRPRRSGVGHAGVMGSPQGQVASGANQHPAAPPCTDYDVAYFKAYSHIGVHEEMLKVFTPHSSHISSFSMGDNWADVFPDASAELGFCFV